MMHLGIIIATRGVLFKKAESPATTMIIFDMNFIGFGIAKTLSNTQSIISDFSDNITNQSKRIMTAICSLAIPLKKFQQ
ncbi:MAG: hypothetical protein R2759_06155 [Bacteroidales bacterium]